MISINMKSSIDFTTNLHPIGTKVFIVQAKPFKPEFGGSPDCKFCGGWGYLYNAKGDQRDCPCKEYLSVTKYVVDEGTVIRAQASLDVSAENVSLPYTIYLIRLSDSENSVCAGKTFLSRSEAEDHAKKLEQGKA